jgi:hypothetical protein
MEGDLEPEVWMARAQRKAALRVVVVGLVVLILAGVWVFAYFNAEAGAGSPITRTRIVGLTACAIGALMVLVGVFMYVRARSTLERIPGARVHRS